jgi:hypothetical protein
MFAGVLIIIQLFFVTIFNQDEDIKVNDTNKIKLKTNDYIIAYDGKNIHGYYKYDIYKKDDDTLGYYYSAAVGLYKKTQSKTKIIEAYLCQMAIHSTIP